MRTLQTVQETVLPQDPLWAGDPGWMDNLKEGVGVS